MDGAIIHCSASSFRPVQGTRTLISRRFSLAILAILATSLCHPLPGRAASVLDFDPASPQEILLAQRAIADSTTPHTVPPPIPPANATASEEMSPMAHKSVGKAFLLNLVIPGAGYLYAGEKRGFVNLGLEGVSWAAEIYYHDLGRQKEREFESYLDGHWNYAKWDSIDGANNPDHASAKALIDNFSVNNRQQYYEDIGKISTYWSGWDSQDNRNFYRGIRAHSNNFLKNAHTAVAGAFVNRIVSAVDVLRVMKNRSHAMLGKDTNIRFKMRTRPFSRDNAFGFVVTRRLD